MKNNTHRTYHVTSNCLSHGLCIVSSSKDTRLHLPSRCEDFWAYSVENRTKVAKNKIIIHINFLEKNSVAHTNFLL